MSGVVPRQVEVIARLPLVDYDVALVQFGLPAAYGLPLTPDGGYLNEGGVVVMGCPHGGEVGEKGQKSGHYPC